MPDEPKSPQPEPPKKDDRRGGWEPGGGPSHENMSYPKNDARAHRSAVEALLASPEVCNESRQVAVEFAPKVERVQPSKQGFQESGRLNYEVDLCSMLIDGLELMIEGNRGSHAPPANPLPALTRMKLDHRHPGPESGLHLQHALSRRG
jgi:hypothetical protein